MLNLTQLIEHPETMSRDTLYDLRSLLALYPYHQTARLLLLENLFILHDASFDEELRRASLFITNRRAIFNLVEAAHYRLTGDNHPTANKPIDGQRTTELIDTFLETQPEEDVKPAEKHRRPTPADATTDYVAYLLDLEREEEKAGKASKQAQKQENRTSELIEEFINSNNQKIQLDDIPEHIPDIDTTESNDNIENSEYLTETLAHIYIKQGRYSQALEIIKRLNLNYPKKSIYFADQIRFLEKLVKNSKQ